MKAKYRSDKRLAPECKSRDVVQCCSMMINEVEVVTVRWKKEQEVSPKTKSLL
jgi:hypothetical protein